MFANHHHTGGVPENHSTSAEDLLSDIQAFLRTCSRPALLEHGDPALPLLAGQHQLEIRNSALYVDAWPTERSFSRRVLAIEAKKPGLLECTIQLFGNRKGRLSFLDLDHPRATPRVLRGGRRTFGEEFRRMLARQFPGWQIEKLSTEMDLTKSFSPVYPRAVLKRGGQSIAAVACAAADQERGLLSFALLWHHHVSGRAANRSNVPLALFFPDDAGGITALRLKWLNISCRVFRFNSHGSAGEVDLEDLGNLDTQLIPRKPEVALNPEWERLIGHLKRNWGVESVREADGTLKLTCDGLEFARIAQGQILCGIHIKNAWTAAHPDEIEILAKHLFETRKAITADRLHPLFRMQPERKLEAAVRRNLPLIDATLENQPILGQVITFAADDRDIIDLISITQEGRLSVIELKADEDIHLPLQALDYWMRVRWHAYSGDFDTYFAGSRVQHLPPKLLLVAPSVRFHPSNATVLSYFSPEIETERIGLNLEWQQGLKVAFRLSGAEEPQSQWSGDGRYGTLSNSKSSYQS